MTLKLRLGVTEGHYNRHHSIYIYIVCYLMFNIMDGDLEMWVRGHSRSLKLVPFESLRAVSYIRLPYGAILYRLRDIASY